MRHVLELAIIRGVPNSLDITSLKMECQIWSNGPCKLAFCQVKAFLYGGPLFHSPDFSLLFVL